MAVLNFPSSPSNGDNYVENGVTYTYTGTHPNGFWKADNQNYVTDIYMSTAGDTMTGNLLITPLGGGGNVALYADNNGQLRASAGSETLVSPFVDKAGSTMTGDLVFAGAQITSSGGKAKFGGTGTPDELLELYSTGSDVALELNYNDSKKAKIELTTGGDLEIRGTDGAIKFFRGDADGDSSTELASFTTGGALLVGTSTASSYSDRLLTVGNTSHASPTIEIRSSTTGFAGLVFSDGVAADNSSYRGSLEYDHTNDLMQIRTAGNVVSTIDSSGSLGIGTTSPNESLEVAGEGLKVSGQSVGITDDGLTFDWAGGIGRIFAEGSGDSHLDFYTTNGGTRNLNVRFDKQGRIGIGTTSPGAPLSFKDETALKIQLNGGATNYYGISKLAGGGNLGDGEFKFTSGDVTAGAFTFSSGGSERMRVDSSGNVGIGLTNLSGSGSLTLVAGQEFKWAGSGGNTIYGGIYANDQHNLIFRNNNGNERMRITSSGYVGIGSSDPKIDLQTKDSGGLQANAANEISLRYNMYYSGGDKYIQSSGKASSLVMDSNGNFRFYNTDTASTSANSAVSGLGERMRIDSSGHLLLGTDSNTTSMKAQIEGTSAADGLSIRRNAANTAGPSLIISKSRGSSNGSYTAVNNGDTLGTLSFRGADGNTDDTAAQIQVYVDSPVANGEMPGRIEFATNDGSTGANPTERMRIDRNGGIYTYAQAGTASVTASSDRSAGSTYATFIGRHSSSSVGGGTNSFIVFTNGDVQNTNNSYGALSDIKLKENIVDANSQWDDIKAVQFRNYNLKEETGHETFTQLGVIAQELEQISPGLVGETPDMGYVTRLLFDEDGAPVVDENGNQLSETTYEETGTCTKNVKYSVLYMKAMVALQEAMERIEALEVEVTALKNA